MGFDEAVMHACATIRSLGHKPSVRTVAAALAGANGGRGFRWEDIRRAMLRATVGQQPGNAFEHDGQRPGNLRAGAPADLKGMLDMAGDSGTNVPPSPARAASPTRKRATKNGSRAPKLPLVDATEERSREILALFWPRVHLAVGTTLTQTEWRRRNKRDALNLAAVGRSDADLREAHERASQRLGSCVYSLRIVIDELLRIENPVTSNGRGGPYGMVPLTIAPEDRR